MGRGSGAAALFFLLGCATPPPLPSYPAPSLPPFRAPAVPLFVQTPYLNVWLCGDRLADEPPKLWNGQIKGMAGMIKIDGRTYRFLGLPGSPLPPMAQESVRILPTRTEFVFSQGDVRLAVEFLTPLDPRDLKLLSLPVGLLRAEVSCGKPHSIQVYFDVTGEWAVGSSDRRITWDGMFRIRPSQPRLFRETNNYPDWGEVHWSAVDGATSQYGVDKDVRQAFVDGKSPMRDTRYPRPASEDWPVFAHHWDLGKVDKPAVRRALLGHVRREAVNFFGTVCPSAWTAYHHDGAAMIAWVASQFDAIRTRASAVDAEVVARARDAGGDALAALAALVFRQSFAASEPALHGNEMWLFTKSMDISGTSYVQSLDVLYPAAPALLAFNPALLRMQLLPILEALRRPDWRERFAMRDLGAYPNATGQLQSEAGRLQATAELILLAACVRKHFPEDAPAIKLAALIAEELERTPSHPELSLKLNLAVACLPGAPRNLPVRLPLDSGGPTLPSVLLDRYLHLALIRGSLDGAVAEFRGRTGPYGVPSEPGRPPASVVSQLWLAALSSREEVEAAARPVLRFYAETPVRVPAADRYETDTLKPSGTQARPVMGAVFAPLLLRDPPPQR